MVTGKGTRAGNNVSHSNRKTKRTFKANVHKKRVYLEESKAFVTLHLSTRALRTIQKKGLAAALRAKK
jgi:large subunit ribosomal protein L28